MPQADRDATRRAFSKPAAFVVLTKGLTLKTELTAARLRELLHYDPDTGVFIRRVPAGGRNGRKFPAGTIVGTVGALGYLEVGIDGCSYLLHRLAVLYMTGQWPSNTVDHRDGVRSNNRWLNLRDVDNATNIENRKRPNKNNRCGVLGCYQDKGGRWVAQIMVRRKCHVIGRFDDAESAGAAYVARKREVHRGCTL